MAQIVIFGGTGYSGGNIAREAVGRGHNVTSYTRNAPAEPIDGVDYRLGSMADPDVVKAAAQGADQLVVALKAEDVDGAPMAARVPTLIEAARTHDARLSFVGGAGSSLVAEGGPRLVDGPDFHEDWKPEALAHADVLELMQQAPEDLDWFYVSPAALYGSFAPGETTGSYRTGGDVLVTKEDGSSEISGTDLARAYVDEIESRAHPRQRFTVGH
ncbi:NAD(P)-dependent oxidoreductase [Ornithinimicrobium murale]|uniref:NAD(P)-dependent oxidoreductase n=1 Tax=Ornithinimicrobium murale TaxID=1050153 RepID=UPI00192DA790|nr:NAD(P)H-binding protein [Ornithinimicrobium murale]